MDGWIVGQVAPMRHDLAEGQVQNQGAELYAPKCSSIELGRGGRRVRKTGRLFGTYAFVKVLDDHWNFLLGTLGLRRVLCTGDFPACVPDSFIEQIRSREDADGFVRLPVKLRFAVGQAVRLERGHLAGQVGIYDGASSLERENVLLNLMGREVRVSVGAGSLAPA